jgi:hypothetical protein
MDGEIEREAVSAHLHASNYGIVVVVEECSRLRRTQSKLDSACRVRSFVVPLITRR